jgi:hypothetical protein
MGEDEVPELPLCGGRRGLTDVRGHCGGYTGCMKQGCDMTMRVDDCASRWNADGGCETEVEDTLSI